MPSGAGGPLLLAAVAAAAFGVGHVCFEALVRPASPARLLPSAERGFAKLAFGFLAASWAGVALAEVGRFSIPWLVGILVALAAGVVAASPRRQRSALARLSLDLDDSPAVLVLLVAAAFYLYFPPFEVVLEAGQAAVHQLSGALLARQGSLAPADPPPAGMGRLLPPVLPLFPVWVAVGHLAAGVAGGLAAAPLMALLAAAALYYLGRRLVHPAVGTGAALLLAAGFVQLWFARSGGPGLAAQALVLLGCYGLTLERRHGDAFFGLMAGVAFGLTWLTGAALWVLAVPLVVLLVTDLCRGRPERVAWWSLWAPLPVLWIHALAHAWGWSPDAPRVASPARLLGLGAVAAVVVAAALLTKGWPASRRRRANLFLQGASPSGRRFRWALTGALVVLATYGYWLGDGGTGVAALVRLGWAVTPLALWLGILGAVLVLHDRRAQRGMGAIVGLLLSSSLVALGGPAGEALAAYPPMLPVLLPTTLLLAAYGWWRLWSDGPGWAQGAWGRLRRARAAPGSPAPGGAALPAGLVAVLLVAAAAKVGADALAMSRRYRSLQVWQGSLAFLREVGDAVGPGGVLLLEPPPAWPPLRLAAPLAILADREVVQLPSSRLSPEVVARLVGERRRGAGVYLLTAGGVDYFSSPRAEPVRALGFASAVLERTRHRLPRALVPVRFRLAIYRLLAGGRNPPLPGVLDLGRWDELYVTGFGPAGVDPAGVAFRWSRETSGLWLPGLTAEARRLLLRLGTGPPGAARPESVSLALDGVELGSVRLRPGWRTYPVPLPPGWRPRPPGPPLLVLRGEGWRPGAREVGGAGRLGVKVDWVAWEGAAGAPRPGAGARALPAGRPGR